MNGKEVDFIDIVNLFIAVLMLLTAYLSFRTQRKAASDSNIGIGKVNTALEAGKELLKSTQDTNEMALTGEILKQAAAFVIEVVDIDFDNDVDKLDESFSNYANIRGVLSVRNTSDVYVQDLCFNINVKEERQELGISIPPQKQSDIPFFSSLKTLGEPEYINGDKKRIYKHTIRMHWRTIFDFEADASFYFSITKVENDPERNYNITVVPSLNNDKCLCYLSNPKVSIMKVIERM